MDAKRMAKKFKTKVSPKTLKRGMNIEMEHGLIDPETNVTNNDLEITSKIAMAHIKENPKYYDYLNKLEMCAKDIHALSCTSFRDL